jgi:RNA polymerase sigma-70 factor (ECF subfamily)
MAEHATSDLVALAQGGDAAAFAALYERHAPAVCRFLRARLGGSPETAEDLASAVFLKVWEKLGLYDERGVPFGAWLFRIDRNHLIDYVRQQRARTAESLDLAAHVPDAGSGNAFGQALDRKVLEDALARLSPEQRQAVTLRFLGGFSGVETARAMEKSEDAVKKLQARGLASLRRLLSEAPVGRAAGRPRVFAA